MATSAQRLLPGWKIPEKRPSSKEHGPGCSHLLDQPCTSGVAETAPRAARHATQPPGTPRGSLLTRASVLGQGAARRLLQVPGHSLHGGLGPQRRGLRGALLLPHSQTSRRARHHSGPGRTPLEQEQPLGTLGPGQGLRCVFTVHWRRLPSDDSHGRAGVLVLAGGRGGRVGGEGSLRGGVRALRGGWGAHVIQLHENAFPRKVFKDVPRLDGIPIIQVLGRTPRRHLWDSRGPWEGLGLGPFC